MNHLIPEVEGARLFQIQRHEDERGYFQEIFSCVRYDANLPHVAQVNLSCSHAGVVRGLHMTPFAKLVTCLSGGMYDVVADLRKNSPTYGNWVGFWLSPLNRHQVYVPPGCHHGLFSLLEGTVVLYQQDGLYDPSQERVVHPFDPGLNVVWPKMLRGAYTLSARDSSAPWSELTGCEGKLLDLDLPDGNRYNAFQRAPTLSEEPQG